uniref:Genome polyprotein n=1 Tax=Gentiana straminea waikavirus TaxID=3115788 RepID=A0AAT9J7X3_9SECO
MVSSGVDYGSLHISSKMSKQSTNNSLLQQSKAVSPSYFLKLVCEPAVIFAYNNKCNHSNSLSIKSNLNCHYCSLLYKINKFHKFTGVYLNRVNISYLVDKTYIELFKSSCKLYLKSVGNIISDKLYAKSLADNQFGSEYACPLSGMSGVDFENCNPHHCWNLCDNAKHLFECFSSCDETRGEYFPVPREGCNWHATCSACGASCSFATPREGMILAIFFHLLEIVYDGKCYMCRIGGTYEYVKCSRDFAELIVDVQGTNLAIKGIHIEEEKVPKISIYSDVFLGNQFDRIIDYGGSIVQRFAKDSNVLQEQLCAHTFYLTSCTGYQLKLNECMLRLLMMLIPGHGYLNGIGVDSNGSKTLITQANGILCAGGLKGVNLRCNLDFCAFHEAFYLGSFRTENKREGKQSEYDSILAEGERVEIEPYVPNFKTPSFGVGECSKQMYSQEFIEECDRFANDDDDLESNIHEKLAIYADEFKNDDEELFIIPTRGGRIQGRGLKDLVKRVGGVLTGVTNCITKLHALWDWPLDTLLKNVKDVGEWLSDNREHVSDKVWSCTMCPEIQKKTEETLVDQNKILEMLSLGMKRLSATIDAFSKNTKENIDSLDKRLSSIDLPNDTCNSINKCLEEINKLKGMSESFSKYVKEINNLKSFVESFDKRLDELEGIRGNSSNSGTSPVVVEMLKNHDALIDLMRKSVKKLEEQYEEMFKGKSKSSFPKPPIKINNSEEIGEQMAIPRFNSPQPIRKYGKKRSVDDDDDFLPFEIREGLDAGKTSIVTAQSGKPVGNVVFEGSAEEKEIVKTSHITSAGKDESHNALLSDIFLGSVSWGVSNGEGKILENFFMPESIWANNERLSNFASYFQYYTCSGLEFIITTTSVGMQGGTLMVCWDAMSCATKQKIDTVIQLSNLPSEFIYASSSQRLVFSIDSPSIQHMMCLSGSEKSIGSLGTLKICIANGLNAAAETSQTISINVWVRFLNPKFSFYTMKHDIVFSQSMNGAADLGGLRGLGAIVAEGKWSTTTSTNLMELTVHPTACHVNDGIITQTSLSVISHLFSRWSGSLIFRFHFAASMFVKGKVLASAIPVAFRLKKMTIAQITSFPHIVCDLSSDVKEFELVVPYNSVGRNSLICRDSIYDVSSYNAELVVSRLHMVVLDPLVMNSNSSNEISYFVTMRPGHDFALFDMSGVKTEYVDRVLKQSLFETLSSGKLVGSGFSTWTSMPSVLHKFTVDAQSKNALCVMVSPCYRSNPPCITSLSWLSQIFVEWTGSLIYTLRAHSHERNFSSLVRIWHDINGSTQDNSEFEFLSDVDPPAGMKVYYWKPFEQAEINITVPFMARTEKLLVHKARYTPTADDWLHYYNGMLVIDYEGVKGLNIEMSIHGGDDFEFFEQTVPPRCGNVSNAFTKLSYAKKLKNINIFPMEVERLSGPINKAIVTPVVFKPVPSVTEKPAPVETKKRDVWKNPREGDTSFDADGAPVVFTNGRWEFQDDAIAQMDCIGCVRVVRESNKTVQQLHKRDTVNKVIDLVDAATEVKEQSQKVLPQMYESMQFMLPLLEKVDKFVGSAEEKISLFDSMREKIMGALKGLFNESIPGMLNSAFENENYVWATILTIIGGVSLIWFCKTRKSFVKKFSVLCMIVWSPFLVTKVWELGKWIKRNIWNLFSINNDETCRKHSNAGTFESLKGSFGNFTDWFSENWEGATKNILMVLGVVASLVVWGSIPDNGKIKSFSEKFKEAGNKGRSFSNILSGFTSIHKVSKEWSGIFVDWMLGSNGSSLPKADSNLQLIVKFDIVEWVKEVRAMALAENKFAGFGTIGYIEQVRHLYDKSCAIQEVIMSGIKLDVQLSMIIKECKDKCVDLLNSCYTFKGMGEARIDPIHICMIGKPGVGKSATSHVLINNLLDYMGEPEVDRIYIRCCADAYWSNYRHEPCILYDDLGAINSKLKMSDFAEIMGIKTNDPFSVPMAAVEDKGKHCTSKYVFSCTNVLELDDNGDVVTKSAYYRRRNVLVEVEREEGIVRDESNPTHGLLFTVKGYHLDGDRVHFGVKEEWNEDFLRDIDTQDWRFERVEFITFLKFLCEYTRAYMNSQEKLLKGISGYRINPFEEDVVNAQVSIAGRGEEKSLGEVIELFDKFSYKYSDFTKTLSQNGVAVPQKWSSNKKVVFSEMLSTMCGCLYERNCNFDFYLQRMVCSLSGVRRKPVHDKFVCKKLNKDPFLTTILVKDASLFDDLEPLDVFVTLATIFRWSNSHGPCFYQSLNRDSRDFLNVSAKCSVNFEFDDRIPKNLQSYVVEGKKILIWPSVIKFYPHHISTYGYTLIRDGEEVYRFAPKKNVKIDFSKEDIIWNENWSYGMQCDADTTNFFHPDDRIVLKSIVEDIENLSEVNFDSCDLKRSLSLARELFCDADYFSFLIHLTVEHSKQVGIKSEGSIKEEKKKNFLRCVGKIGAVEEKTVKELSKPAKIALSIGAGIAGAGLIVGIVIALKNLFSLTIGEKQPEELEKEISGGGASGFFQTQHVIKGKRQPRTVITTLEKHVSSGGASGNFETKRVIKGRKNPMVLSKEMGFGVTYGEETLKPHIYKELRKAKRRNFIMAVKESGRGRIDSVPVVKDIGKWQNGVKKQGINPFVPDNFTNGPLKKIRSKVENDNGIDGLHLTTPDDLGDDEDVSSAIETLLKLSKKEINEIVENGVTVKVEKQSHVGDFGMIKDRNMVELLTTHVNKMSAMLIINNKGVWMQCSVLRLQGTFVVLPAHYWEQLQDADFVGIITQNVFREIEVRSKDFILVSSLQDLMVWDVGNNVPPCANYVKHIATRDDWEHYNTCSGALSITNYGVESSNQIIHMLDKIELVDASVEVPTGVYEIFDSTHTIIKGLRYRVYCMPGFCGAAIVRADSRCTRKILGIHVAGAVKSHVGYAEILVQEEIMNAIESLQKLNCVSNENCIVASHDGKPDVDFCSKQAPCIPGKGTLGVLGLVGNSSLPNLPAKTSICKSFIHGMIGPVKSEPAILSKWDSRLGPLRGAWDPVLEGVKKYGSATKPFDRDEIDIVRQHLSSFFKNHENSRRARKVNDIEVGINGIDGTDFWAGMEMKTSAGYPYVLRKPSGATGKSWLFKDNGKYPSGRSKYEMSDPGFISSFELMHSQIKEGIVPQIITMECPKDERRRLSKIYDKPSTRTFTILPPEINLLFRMYFGDFAAMVMETRASHFSQVGINPESLEWSELMNNFLKVSNKGFAGDYAKFDGIGSPEIYHSIVSLVNKWYNDGEENARARQCLISSIIHRYGIAGDILMRYSQGMPSGFSMTVIFNSFVNYYYMALAWQTIVGSSILSPQSNLKDFDYYTKIIVYGDDNVVAVDKNFLDIYNLRTVASYLSEYGISYTDDAKNPIHLSDPYVDITSVTFLKRSFVLTEKTGMIWKSPLDKVSIEERCNWIRSCEIPEEALDQNIESALYEASIHGKDYFIDLLTRLNMALKDVVLPERKETFEECQSRWWGNMTNHSLSQVDLRNLVDSSIKNNINIGKKYKEQFSNNKFTLKEILNRARLIAPAKYIP